MDDLVKLEKRFKAAKLILYWLAGIVLTTSLSTIFWPTTKGQLIYSTPVYHSNGTMHSPPDGKYGRYQGSFTIQFAKYTYDIDQKTYRSSLLCLCIPIGLQLDEHASSLNVYYLPFLESVSVVVPGPHFLLSGILVLFGGLFQILQRVVHTYYRAHLPQGSEPEI